MRLTTTVAVSQRPILHNQLPASSDKDPYSEEEWRAYCTVNKKFSEKVGVRVCTPRRELGGLGVTAVSWPASVAWHVLIFLLVYIGSTEFMVTVLGGMGGGRVGVRGERQLAGRDIEPFFTSCS